MPTPAPIVVEASGKFQGNDGAWSTFQINVGNPPTQLNVLASTEIPETWVIASEGCVATDPSNCTQTRGGVFNGKNSTTWNVTDNYQLGAESNLGLTQNSDIGQYGFDTLAVAVPGGGNTSLDNQLIARVATKDFYLGNLGLANRRLVLGGGDPQSGFLSQINASNLIPSLSYGFTAGASYLPSNASLTLGGVDASRFTPNSVTITFGTDPLRSKLVALQSIVATDSKSETPLLDVPILALVDSTVPHIWLPDESCQEFEKAFGIKEDIASGLYLINDTTHDALIKRNASISFQLSNILTGGPAVNITLPYKSFDLTIAANAAPLVKSPTRYFPLRRAVNDTQYTLGRTFLQESYLIVNYESNNFSISQSRYSKDSPSQIVPIQHVQSKTTTSSTGSPTGTGTSALPPITTTSATSAPSHSLGTPAIAGIAVAVVLLLVVAGAIGVWFRIKRKRTSRTLPPELAADPTFPRDKAELEDRENGQVAGSSHDKKGPRTSVESVSDEKQAQMDQQEIGLMDQGNSGFAGSRVEMSGSEVLYPSELPSPDPFMGHELSSSEAERIHSELSTPEPLAAEMPTPEMISQEMPSPDIGGTSPPRGASPSPLSSPERTYPKNRPFSRRPVPGSMDSSESEGGWTRDGMAPAPTRHAPHSRPYTAEPSDSRQHPGRAPDRVPSSASARHRPQHSRADSTDSETTLPTATIRSIRPTQTHVRADSTDSEAFLAAPQRRPSLPPSRPPHRRLESKDSVETFETRLEQSPPGSPPFFPAATRVARDRPIEAIPSLGPQSSQEALVSPSTTSVRSGLRSPEPLEQGLLEEDEDKAARSEAKRREER